MPLPMWASYAPAYVGKQAIISTHGHCYARSSEMFYE